jgi:hypothetical protein
MLLGDRLGLSGLIMTLVGIAVVYLWTDKRWIGYVCLAAAGLLVVAWAYLEGKRHVGRRAAKESDVARPVPVGQQRLEHERDVQWFLRDAKSYSAEELRPSPSWPEVLLQWKWSAISAPALPNSWTVRNRSLALSSPDGRVVYNVSISDIDLGKYDAKFHVFPHLTRHAELLFPVIYRKNGQAEKAHDFESCLTHTEEPRKMYGGEGPDSYSLKIPFKVCCQDKLGDKYEIPYSLHYEIYDGSGEAFPTGGIRKII